eukprot:8044748-Pyramimonas_sp.AAC.1
MGPLAWGFVEESVERFNTFSFVETHVQGSHFEKWRVAAKRLDLKILANHARPSRKGLLEGSTVAGCEGGEWLLCKRG